MKPIITFFFIVSFCANLPGQKTPTEEAIPIVEEGKKLYKSEMASWYGTDLFLENYKNHETIGGYFSYTQNDTSICVFFSQADEPRVIGTIAFDSTFNVKTASMSLEEREFLKDEKDLFEIREIALSDTWTDSLYKTYKNTNLNLIPLIDKGKKKVYILTGPKESGVVIFGNDYLITFDDRNEIIERKQLHKNIIPIYYGTKEQDKEIVGAMHSHTPETGDFITATDICTLMLYGKYAKWKTHVVVSQKYLNTWNCETNTLTVVPMDTVRKIDDDQENKKKNKKKRH